MSDVAARRFVYKMVLGYGLLCFVVGFVIGYLA